MTAASLDASRARRWLALGVALAGALTNLATSVAIETCSGGFVLHPEGDAQTGVATAPLGRPLLLGVQCRGSSSGNLVPAFDEEVTWTVSGGGGLVDGRPSASTRAGMSRYVSGAGFNSTGAVAAVHWQLGNALGEQTVQVQVGGQTFTYRATATAPTPGGTCADGGGTDLEEARYITGDQRWVAAGSPYRGRQVRVQTGARLTVDAGSQACLSELIVEPGAALVVAGEPASPVRMSGRPGSSTGWTMEIGFPTSAQAPRSEIRHLQATNLTRLWSFGAITLEDSRFELDTTVDRQFVCPSLHWDIVPDGAATMQRVVIDGYGGSAPAACPALQLSASTSPPGGPRPVQARVLRAAGDAVAVRGTARNALALSACEISGAGRHGLVVAAESRADVLTVSGCNLTGNAGLAMLNEAAGVATLAARGNWWGSAGGPPAGGANGISSGIDASGPLAAPAALGD